MKRLAFFAAAVVLVSGMTYLSFARDEAKVENKSAEHSATETGKPVVNSGTETVPSSPSSQPAVKADSGAKMGEPTKVEPTNSPVKKSEPVAENKPGATLSDTGKTTGQNASEHGKSTVSEAAKSTLPSAHVPTTPTQAVAKTVGTPAPVPTTPTK